MQPTAHFTADELRRMANYHARPPADWVSHERNTSAGLSAASFSSSFSPAPFCAPSPITPHWISPEEVSAHEADFGATSFSSFSSSSSAISAGWSRHSRNRQAPSFLADYVFTPPQENKKKRRLVVASQAASRPQDDTNQQPIIAAASDNEPRLHCPFSACTKASPSFAGWQRADQLLQHINCIHASKNQWPSEAFLPATLTASYLRGQAAQAAAAAASNACRK